MVVLTIKKLELSRLRAVLIYRCLPSILTWTFVHKLSITVAQTDNAILVKPREKIAQKYAYLFWSLICFGYNGKMKWINTERKLRKRVKSRFILRILSLPHKSSFSDCVKVLSWPFPCMRRWRRWERSKSWAIRQLKSCIEWGNVIVSEILWIFSKWACILWWKTYVAISTNSKKHWIELNWIEWNMMI